MITHTHVHPQKLDVITNDLLKRALRFTGKLGVLASEEEDAPVSNRDCHRTEVQKERIRV